MITSSYSGAQQRSRGSNEEDNLLLGGTPESVDLANQEFYTKFPYPRPPITFPQLEDPDFERVMLNQSIGDFSQGTIPEDAKIWVAGCGTNQPVYTALRFPKATIIGSDLSSVSLEICGDTAKALGIKNLVLRQESLNQVAYREEFDYVLSTGVVHHNSEPAKVLGNIAQAMRPHGVLELMVYNRFHRIFNVAFQKAVRAVSRYEGHISTYEQELEIAKAFAATEPIASSAYMARLRHSHESHFADALVQPVEYGYTVESLGSLAAHCGLDLTLPCNNQFDRSEERVWTIQFSSRELQERIDALPDVVRWQVANLLLLERSPMLWFFFRRHQDSVNDVRYELRTNQEFLDRKFTQTATCLRNYVRGSGMNYELSSAPVSYPFKHHNSLIRGVVQDADGTLTMRQVLSNFEVDSSSRKTITDIRMQTTTSVCPYLRAVRE